MTRIVTILLLSASSTLAAELTFDTPSDDRWHYPFNFSPGFRATGSCFGAVGTVDFNNRDGIVLVAWDTSSTITPGQGAENYDIQSMTITLTNQANENINPDWPIDLTTDEWFTYDLNGDGLNNDDGIPRGEPGDVDGESDDPDPGRPLEVFGVGFGTTTDEASWNEFTGYIGDGPPPTISPRDPFPFVYQDGTSEMLHVEEHVDGLYNEALGVTQFTPVPWATGTPSGYTPGNQNTPFDVTFEIDLDLSDGQVREYFQQQLNNGRVIVAVTSLKEIVEQGPSSAVPSFYMKEGTPLDPGAKAPSLVINVGTNAIPAVSTWGLATMALMILTTGTLVIRAGRQSLSKA
ncbi:MAG: hypothetical protein ACYTHJ_16520 [Planctomycetota bacterium]|jgi:hypothetical protein